MPDTTDATAVTRRLRNLRQARRFTTDPIPDATLRDLLEVARWSGSAKNTQPWHFIVVTDAETRSLLAECGPYAGFLAGAPLVIVVAMAGQSPGSEAYDEGRVAERLMLAADAHGLGAGTGWFVPGADGEDRVKTALGIPADMAVRQAIGIGYRETAEQRERSVHGGRRPVTEIVSFERFGQH